MRIEKLAATVLAQLQAWRDELAPEEISSTPLPIISVPEEWIEKVQRELRLKDGDYPHQIWNCEVLVTPNAEYPALVRHDGVTVVLDRKWRADLEALRKADARRKRKSLRLSRDIQPAILH